MYVLFLPGSVIWNVVLLELLSDMVRRWHVGSAVAENRGQLLGFLKQTWKDLLLPHVVTRQTHNGDQ